MNKIAYSTSRSPQFKLSIVVPCHNESMHLNDFVRALKGVATKITSRYEILLINDGSQDDTRSVALSMLREGQVRYIEFSRNFGKEAALMAGIDHADGDAVVLIDADFQHPLEKLSEMSALWHQGYDMIYGIIVNRSEEALFKRLGTNLFYRLLRFSEVPIPRNAGDFRWLDRKVVLALKSLPERNRFMKGLYSWVGFKSIAIEFIPAERKGGSSSFNPGRLTGLALAGLTSFSTMPLRIWTALGFLVSIMAIIYGLYIAYLTLTEGNAVSGWPTLTVALMFFSGVQLFSIGVLGEYIARIFNEVKQRPLYVIADDQSSQ